MTLAEWMARRLGWTTGTARSSSGRAVEGYLALSTRPGFTGSLDARTVLMARRLAAVLSGCSWCIDRAAHECRSAGLPLHLLDELSDFSASTLFSARERAALAFVRDLACMESDVVEPVARSLLSDVELAELTAIVVEHHWAQTSTPT
jgi:alkylhydroperoxidase family enzyme